MYIVLFQGFTFGGCSAARLAVDPSKLCTIRTIDIVTCSAHPPLNVMLKYMLIIKILYCIMPLCITFKYT